MAGGWDCWLADWVSGLAEWLNCFGWLRLGWLLGWLGRLGWLGWRAGLAGWAGWAGWAAWAGLGRWGAETCGNLWRRVKTDWVFIRTSIINYFSRFQLCGLGD